MLLVVSWESASSAQRSQFRLLKTTRRGDLLTLQLAYQNPGATRRPNNRVKMFAFRDGAPYHDNASGPGSCVVESWNKDKRRSQYRVSEGICLSSVEMPQDAGTCELQIRLSDQAFCGVRSGDEIWIAGRWEGIGHNWGTWSGLGNQTVSFLLPEAATSAKK